MKKLQILVFSLILTASLNAQSILLDVPISPIDSLQDQSVFNNPMNWFGLSPIALTPDESNVANSAFECGTRTYLEVDYSNLVNLQIDTLSFYVKIIMEDSVSNPFFPFPTNGKGLIFGQESNLGLRYNYADGTISDYDSLITYNVLQPFTQWLSLRLSYYPNSTVELWVNNSLIGTAQRNTNQLLDTTNRLGLGLYDSNEYLHARVDSIQLLRGTPPVIVDIDESKPKDLKMNMAIYPNPTKGQLNIEIDHSMIGKRFSILNLSGQIQLEGRFAAEKSQLELSQFSKGIYFLSIPEFGLTKKVVIF